MHTVLQSSIRTSGSAQAAGQEHRRPLVAQFPDHITKRFQDHYPLFLDGSLTHPDDQTFLVRQAHEALAKDSGLPNMMPAALLREHLQRVCGTPNPAATTGITVVAPRKARIWWDSALLRDCNDILAGLDKPRLVLRFYDITNAEAQRWSSVFDIDIALQDNGKSIDFWAPDRTYSVELGILHADGRFAPMATANRFTLPRESRGESGSEARATSSIVRLPRPSAMPVCDQQARLWQADRPDQPYKDADAEMLIHMLYRSFAIEGPRALRCGIPQPKSSAVLAAEYDQRTQQVLPQAPAARAAKPLFLFARLDAVAAAPRTRLAYPPAIITHAASL